MSNKVIYKQYISSKKWKEKKEEVFKLRGKECEQFGYKHRIHVHHLSYENLGDEKMEDLQILCYQCHMSKHEKFFEKLVLKGNAPKKYLPLKEGQIRLTEDLMHNLRTSKGGLTKHVYRLFGYKGIPKNKGWFRSRLGTGISEKEYYEAIKNIREWEEGRDVKKPLSKKNTKNKTLKHSICNDLRKSGINTINGMSISYIELPQLVKLHQVYCS